MSRRWLDTLVRVRTAREDAARADAARAELASEVRLQAAAALQVRLDRADTLPQGTAVGLVAVAAAQAASARALSAAVTAWRSGLVDQAAAQDVLRAAATARRSVDRIAEREREQRRVAAERTEQRVLDEIGQRREVGP